MNEEGLSEAELRALLELRSLPGLSDRRLSRLLRQHGSALAVQGLAPGELGATLDARQARPVRARVEQALRLVDRQRLGLLAVHLPGYPVELLELPDPPPLLFGRGELRLIGQLSVAVVGTRRPTDYGLSVTGQLVAGLARAGVVIWSGAARGIDAAAHRAALESGGATVAVLGSGIDVPYPREHEGLLDDIAASGLVLSEFMPGEPPIAHHFPQRNRIIARLAHGILVVEARPDGGALITADAGASSRPIMAVPGPIGRLTSLGPNRLIQEGAKLVVEVADILEEIGGPLNAAAACGRPSARRSWQKAGRGTSASCDPAQLQLSGEVHTAEPDPGKVLAAVRHHDPADLLSMLGDGQPRHVDEVAAACALSASAALSRLLELELAGVAERLSGNRFRLSRRPDPGRIRRQAADRGEPTG